MQWTDGKNAGFSDGTPWLKVNPNHKTINVAAQEKDKDSVLNFYRQLVALRKNDLYRDTFTYGDFKPLFEENDSILAFVRNNKEANQNIVVVANFSQSDVVTTLPYSIRKVLLCNGDNVLHNDTAVTLKSCECAVLLCE